MNIDRLNQNLASGAYGRRTNRTGDADATRGVGDADDAGGAAAPTAAPTDGVEVSEEARALSRAEAAVRAAPDVREELVANLRQQVQDGTYQPNDEAVARQLTNGNG